MIKIIGWIAWAFNLCVILFGMVSGLALFGLFYVLFYGAGIFIQVLAAQRLMRKEDE